MEGSYIEALPAMLGTIIIHEDTDMVQSHCLTETCRFVAQ